MSRRLNRNIVWVRPSRTRFDKAARDSFSATLEAAVSEIEGTVAFDLKHALAFEGLPAIPGTNAEEELKELCRAAAEIEHGLMTQYLYASYSCTKKSITDVMKQIAAEEMGHLVTVQNILLAIGATPYLGRYDYSPNDFDPFPFKLQPISREVIAKYTACEMPDAHDVPPEDQDVLPTILADAVISAGNMAPHRVGLLYMKIYWLLRANDEPLPDPTQEPWLGYPVEDVAKVCPGRHLSELDGSASMFAQAKKNDWQASNPPVIVQTIQTRAEALNAVARISSQGEGFAGESNSHFKRFVTGYRVAAGSGTIARNFTTNPWYTRPDIRPGPAESEIKSALALDFSRLGDMLYEILLVSITLALHKKSGLDAQKRSIAAAFCIALMREVMKPFVRALPLLTINDDAGSATLSPCFTLPFDKDDPAELHSNLKARLTDVLNLSKALESRDDIDDVLRSAARTVMNFIEVHQGDVTTM